MTESRKPLEDALADVIRELSAKPSRERRRHGWSDTTRDQWRSFFEQILVRVQAGDPPNAPEVPSRREALKGLDAQGVDVMSSDELVELVMDVCALLRKAPPRGVDAR